MKELTKEELLERLAKIEAKENEIKNELFYKRYKDLSFLQIWKNSIRWKYVIFIALFGVVASLFDSGNSRYLLMFGYPVIITLATISIPLEIKQRIIYMKKNRKDDAK